MHHKVALLSARLSPLAVRELLEKTEATNIVTSKRLSGVAQEAVASSTLPCHITVHPHAAYEVFLNEHDQKSSDAPIASPLHYIADTDRNVLILHSSGTTGLPKPLYSSHRYTLCFTAAHRFSSEEDAQALVLSTLPLYHGYGFVAPWLSLGVGKTFCLPPTSVVSNGSAIATLLRHTGSRALMTVPSILEEIAELADGEGLRTLLPLDFVAFGGGPLKPAIGDFLSTAGVKLLNHYGATEIGPLAPFFKPPQGYDWRYFRLRKDMDLDLVESTTLESKGEHNARYRLIAHPFGWNAPFEVQDELVTDPNNPGIDFTTLHRKDDMIVLATGEKIVPTILESQLSSNTNVRAALAFGDSQFELGVIVEKAAFVSMSDDELRSLLWPSVVEAGKRMDAHARLSSPQSLIITSTSHPLPRSDKGSIMRREAYKVFAAEIAEAYERIQNNSANNMPPLSLDDIEASLRNFMQTSLAWRVPEDKWNCEDDLFELGMDSLQALRLRRYLMSALPNISKDFVYLHPTVGDLASALRMALSAQNGSNTVQDGDNVHINGHAKSHMNGPSTANPGIEAYVRQFKLSTSRPIAGAGDEVILLTGTTGNLGAHLLYHLVRLPHVSKIVGLNRQPRNGKLSPRQQQERSFNDKGLVLTESEWAKMELFQTSTSQPLLGLSSETYSRLSSQVAYILHNAWPVDFKLSLSSFKAQFQTLHNLLHFARDIYSHRHSRARFVFISSIAVVGQYHRVYNRRIVPEVEMDNDRCTNHFGYGQAKLVGERILQDTAHDFSAEIEIGSIRVGQMSGSMNSGYWNPAEHIAALVKSSQFVGRFPVIRGTLSWLPVDTTAAVVSEILLSGQPLKSVYHVENPVRQSWHDVLGGFAEALGSVDANTLPYQQWFKAVSEASDEGNPAKMLSEFFESDFEHMASGGIILDTGNARRASPTLSEAAVVDRDVISKIVHFWRNRGFLQ